MKYIKPMFERSLDNITQRETDSVKRNIDLLSTIVNKLTEKIKKEFKDYRVYSVSVTLRSDGDDGININFKYADSSNINLINHILRRELEISDLYLQIDVGMNSEYYLTSGDIWFKRSVSEISKNFELIGVSRGVYDTLANNYDTKVKLRYHLGPIIYKMRNAIKKINQ